MIKKNNSEMMLFFNHLIHIWEIFPCDRSSWYMSREKKNFHVAIKSHDKGFCFCFDWTGFNMNSVVVWGQMSK